MSGLPVVSFNGLNADSLGTYLASLGLFSLAIRRWPKVRACWRNASFCLVGGPMKMDDIVEFLNKIGEKHEWTQYDKPWDKSKREDVKKKTSERTMLWRALAAEEELLPAFGAHLALDGRVRMNPLLGTGGNAGKRDFAKGWKIAVQNIKTPPRGQSRSVLDNDLRAFLSGEACTYLNHFHAGSWFGAANKIYNHGNPSTPHGKKQPYREGKITPWAMALACEGLPYFAGGASRQLGSRRQPKGAFPFITAAMAPQGADEAGGIEAEVWAPIWSRPMTRSEIRSLFLRGRAELDDRGATSSAAFAIGVMSRGVDAGISEFRRFLLLHTTSTQTFESRLATVVPVPKASPDSATTRAIRSIIKFHGTLPVDRKVGKRWRFSGLRGPLEQTLVGFAATVLDAGNAEQAWALVDEMFAALVKIDRNRTFRSHNVGFRLLPGEWATRLLQEDPPDRETRLALAISSLSGTPPCPPIIAYRIGAQKQKGTAGIWEFPESFPDSRVWSDAELTDNLCAMTERRILKALQKTVLHPPFDAAIRVNINDVHSWLSADVDEERLRLWLDRLCVFDWSSEENDKAAKEWQRVFPRVRPAVDGVLAIYALLRPLVSDWLFRQVLRESDVRAEGISTCTCLSRVIAMLRHGNVKSAVDMALAAYRSAGVALAEFDVLPGGYDPSRLLAALAIPTRDEQTLAVFRRWRMPIKSDE